MDKFIKEYIIEYFGSKTATAKFFNITRQAINDWEPEQPIPELRQLQLKLELPDDFQ